MKRLFKKDLLLVKENPLLLISLVAVATFSLLLGGYWFFFVPAAVWCLFELFAFITDPDPAGSPKENDRVETKVGVLPARPSPYDVQLNSQVFYSGNAAAVTLETVDPDRPRQYPANKQRKGDEYIQDDHPYITKDGYRLMQDFLDEECRRNGRRTETSGERTGEGS